MLIGIHEANYGKSGEKRFQIYRDILEYNNIRYLNLHVDRTDFWQQVKECDVFLYRWSHIDRHRQIALRILPVIENELHIKCFPDLNTCWHFDDKIRQYFLLQTNNFPIVESYIFFDKTYALEWLNTAEFPVVFKLYSGAGSLNVTLVEDKKSALMLIHRMFGKGIRSGSIPVGNVKFHNLKSYFRKTFGPLYYFYHTGAEDTWQIHKNYALFQKFLPDNQYDNRITIIGNRAFGFRRMNRKKDFRSSGSGIIDYNINQIPMEMIHIAFEVCKKFRFQTMAFDFLMNNGKPEFCEISYSYDDQALFNCQGYWDQQLQWHEGHFWPQFLHLQDLLQPIELQIPDHLKN